MQFLTQGKTNWTYIGIVAAVGVVATLAIFWQVGGNEYASQEWATFTKSPMSNQAGTSSNSASLSYAQALKTYAKRRIQFSPTCTVTPSTSTYKVRSTIMLDNRSNKTLRVALDSAVYMLSAYGYKIVTLSTSATLPHTMLIDCGKGQNNGSIVLQR